MEKELADLILRYVNVKCPLCGETFMAKYNLRIHIKKDHTGAEANTFIEENV